MTLFGEKKISFGLQITFTRFHLQMDEFHDQCMVRSFVSCGISIVEDPTMLEGVGSKAYLLS